MLLLSRVGDCEEASAAVSIKFRFIWGLTPFLVAGLASLSFEVLFHIVFACFMKAKYVQRLESFRFVFFGWSR